MDFEARRKGWVVPGPLAELPMGSGHQAQPEELFHRAGNRCSEVQVAEREVHKES